MSFRRILVPLDGTPLAERALYPATVFAEAMNATLVLLRVAVPLSLKLDPELYEYTIKSRQNAAKNYLQRIQSSLISSTIDIKTRVLVGQVTTSIKKCAKQEKIDLLVISSRDRPGGSRLVLGSVATKMLLNPPCAVVIVHPQVKVESFSVQRILVPLFESSLVEPTLVQALELAQCMSAELFVLAQSPSMQAAAQSVLDRHGFYAVTDGAKPQPFEASTQAFANDESLAVLIHTITGLTAEDIFEFADRKQVDLITVCGHRRFGIGQWLIRGTAERVAQGANYVTLILREKKVLNERHRALHET